jgi:single-strand DNA-binding protein
MNVFTAIGRVGRDAVVRNAGETPVASWSLAVDAGFGERKVTTWLDCSLWGKRAESVAQHIRKGDRLGVTGEIATREHDGKTYVTLKVSDVTLLGEKKADAGSNGGRSRSEPAPAGRSQQRNDDPFPDSEIPF